MRVPSENTMPDSLPSSSMTHLGGALLGVHRDAEVFHRPPQDRAGRVVELGVHQRRAGVHDVDGQTAVLQPASRFETEQPAADHHGLGAVRGLGDHAHAVVEGAEPEHPVGQRLVVGPQARHRREERPAAGGQDQLVVVQHGAVVGVHQARVAVDAHHPHAGPQVDAVVGVPVQRVEVDLAVVVDRPAARQAHSTAGCGCSCRTVRRRRR